MLEIALDIQHVASDAECAGSDPRDRMDVLFRGALIFGNSGLQLEPLPLVVAMSALSRAVHTLLVYQDHILFSLDESGTSIRMRRRDRNIEIDWADQTYEFDIVELGSAIGRAYRALVREISARKPDIAGDNANFLTGDTELFQAWIADNGRAGR